MTTGPTGSVGPIGYGTSTYVDPYQIMYYSFNPYVTPGVNTITAGSTMTMPISNCTGIAITADNSRMIVTYANTINPVQIYQYTNNTWVLLNTLTNLDSSGNVMQTYNEVYDVFVTSDGSRIVTCVNGGYLYFLYSNFFLK
jgi:hypothetical protein